MRLIPTLTKNGQPLGKPREPDEPPGPLQIICVRFDEAVTKIAAFNAERAARIAREPWKYALADVEMWAREGRSEY